jgi:acyl-CoA thioesterase-2
MDDTVGELIRRLDLETLEENLFRGDSSDMGGRRVYGGQVLAQAFVAAERTVEAGRVGHSLHGYFLLPIDVSSPIVYAAERIRDGRSFSTRRVQGIQHGRPIFSMIASFQALEPGFEHAVPMPSAPPPEALPAQSDLAERWTSEAADVHPSVAEKLLAPRAIEVRPIDPQNPLLASRREPRQTYWFRAAQRLPDDPRLHRCILAYASDYVLLTTALRPHDRAWLGGSTFLATIDHALWLHRAARVDEWLLYAMDSPCAQSARGLARGHIFDRAGRLVATTSQEGIMREASA